MKCPDSIIAPRLWQWDASRTVACTDPRATEAHFAYESDEVAAVVERTDSGFPVPASLLRRSGALGVWMVEGDRVIASDVLVVRPRPRPSDYVCEPEDVVTVERVEREMEELRQWVEQKVQEGTGPRGSGISAGEGSPVGSPDLMEGDLYIDVSTGELFELEVVDKG